MTLRWYIGCPKAGKTTLAKAHAAELAKLGRKRVVVVDAEGKARELRRMRDALGLDRSQVIGIGDGANDLPFLAEAGVSIAFHAKPAVREAATHCLDRVGLDGVLALFE